MIGTIDIDGRGTSHEVADVDPIVLFDFVNINTSTESPFRPHPHVGLTAMSFLPVGGTWVAWDSLEGDSDQHLQTGGLYYVQLDQGGRMDFQIPPTMRGMLFVIEGKLGANDATVDAEQMMVLGDEDAALATTNLDANCVTRFIIAAGEPVKKPFHKLLGLGGFIIGETEEEVRRTMEELAATAEQIKQDAPHYFPARYL